MFSSDYNATFSVIDSDLETTVTTGNIRPGMYIKVTSESTEVSKMYLVISSSIATGKPATSSSIQSATNTPDKAVDGVISSDAGYKWDASSSEKGGGWLMIDLGKNYTLTQTRTYFFRGWSGKRAYRYNIYAGTTEDNLIKVVDRSDNTAVLRQMDDSLFGITGRYIKLEVLGNSDYDGGNNGALASVMEFEVNGYDLIPKETVIDFENKSVTIPASWGNEVYTNTLLADIFVDGNALLSVQAEAYYLQGGDTLTVTDYAGGIEVYTVQFAEPSAALTTLKGSFTKESENPVVIRTKSEHGYDFSSAAVITLYEENGTVIGNFTESADVHSTETEFSFTAEKGKKYYAVITKNGYLPYTTETITSDGDTIDFGNIKLVSGDINNSYQGIGGDGVIDIDDFIRILRCFANDSTAQLRSYVDINEDGIVNVSDLNSVKTNFGKLAK